MSDAWDYPTPSQAEGEREPGVDEHPEHPDVARSTPSQAEGERLATEEERAEPGAREKDRG
ncbi:hypothetical protein ACF068_09605 [Streptomyces sp. NPDC016309]|uniref:hypothetical protein n=1 Tax=Streptomyces sp. NPDC016309 TaxID=3364965 RepID=UPI0036FFE757